MFRKILFACISSLGFIFAHTAFAQDQTTLHFILCGDDTVLPFYQDVADEFVLENPDVAVDIELVAWGKCGPKTLSLAVAGDPPDLSYLGTRNIKQLANAGLILPVSIPPQKQAIYQPGVLRTVRYKGEYWAYPRAFSTKALFMNCDVFDQAGIACEPPETWEELYATAKAIKDKTGIGGMGLSGKNSDNTFHQFLNYLYSNGGQIVDADTDEIMLDSKEVLETLQFFGKLADVSQNGSTAHERSNLKDLFNDGQLAMYIDGPWGFRQHTQISNSIVAPVPAGPSGKSGSVLVADAIFVHADTGNEQYAMKLAEMFTSVESQYIVDHPDNWGLTPIYQYDKVGYKDLYYEDDPVWKPFVAGIASGGAEPMVNDFKAVQDIMVNMIQGMILKEDTAENLLQYATEELNELE